MARFVGFSSVGEKPSVIRTGEEMMATPETPSAGLAELQEQLKAIRADVATLAELLKGAAHSKAAEAGKVLREQADDLVRRGNEMTADATQHARSTVTSIEKQIAEKPVQSALIALLAGIVIGALGRR
jgi:ElaB/YqjD/DUF883 family membrane-anchored ribosome-binding protein